MPVLPEYAIFIAFAVGLLFGAVLAAPWFLSKSARLESERAVLQSRLRSQEDVERDRERSLAQATLQLRATFDHLARESLSSNSDTFLRLARETLGSFQERAASDLKLREQAVAGLVQPISDALRKTEAQIARIEHERREAYGGIKAQLEAMTENQRALQSETQNLVKALRRPEVRGQWGEITLRRLVELAGMIEHVDFVEQVHVRGEEVQRPDMVVNLPEDRQLVVDAKTPLDAYLEAVEADDDGARSAALKRHAQNLRQHIRTLSGRNYQAQFRASPDFVVLFVPGDQFLSAALAESPSLLEDALARKVMLATPTSLVALLKAVSYGWRQIALAENAVRIRDLAEDLYKRLAVFSEHLANVGRQLERSVDSYNNAVGSLERQVLPGARRFTEMGVSAQRELGELDPIEKSARSVSLAPADRETRERERE